MMRVCLIRHGQTDWNLEGRYQGLSDVPLNDKGRAQARALTEQLKVQPFAAIFSSDLQRARETAEIVASSIHLPVMQDTRLREINQGAWEGQLVEDIKTRYTELWNQRTVDPAIIRPPGGETVEEVAKRVQAAMSDIMRIYPAGPVLIVSHGLALATIICKMRGVPIGQAYSVIPDNAKPLWLDWE